MPLYGFIIILYVFESEANKVYSNTSICIKFRWNAIALVSLNIQEYNKSPVIFLHVLSRISVIIIKLYEDMQYVSEGTYAYISLGT